MNRARSSNHASWRWMIVFTSLIAVAIILGAFLLALLWSVDNIDRVEPLAADYRRLPYYSVLPLALEVVQVARIDRGDLIPNPNDSPPFTPTPSAGGLTATSTPVTTGLPGTPNASATAGITSVPQATASYSPMPTRTPTPTRTGLATQAATPTPRPTHPRPTQSNPTNTPPAASATQPRPSATQQVPTATQQPPTQPPPPTAIPPTQPPPTRTRDPYPPPPTAYP